MAYIPHEIEKRSMEIIDLQLSKRNIELPHEYSHIIKRTIHTTADFEYADIMYFGNNPLSRLREVFVPNTCVITDTTMALSGINKRALARFGMDIKCFIADSEIAKRAKANNTTRSYESMKEASKDEKNKIFVIGNAPTALLALNSMIRDKKIKPSLIVGMPVGFVNVIESKEVIMNTDIPCIVSKGNKGGSNVAAAVMNAILYSMM